MASTLELDFLIIGSQKCASTMIHRSLANHPRIEMPQQEIGLLEKPDYDPDNCLELLEELFSSQGNPRLRGIKRPTLFGKEECPGIIYKNFPRAKLIVVTRDPIDRAVSAYYWYMKDGFLPLQDLNTGMRKILAGEFATSYPRSSDILTFGLYYECLQRYLNFFPEDQILQLDQSEVFSNPEVVMDKVYAFLGIEGYKSSNNEYRAQNVSIWSMTRLKLLRLRNPFIYEYYHGNCRIRSRKGIISSIINLLFRGIDEAFLKFVTSNRRPDLDPELRAQLMKYYEADSHKFKQWQMKGK